MIYILLFCLGTMIGSFVQCVSYRLYKDISFIEGRSKCEYCQSTLKWYELIPLFSYLFQLGKCSHCHHEISVIHPITEILFGLIIVLFNIKYSLCYMILYLLLIVILYICAYYDYHTFTVHCLFNYILILVGAFLMFINKSNNFITILIAFIMILIYLILDVLNLELMGLGDVEMFVALDMILGFKQFLTMITITFNGALIILLIYNLFARNKYKNQPIPFIPFIFFGTIITLCI